MKIVISIILSLSFISALVAQEAANVDELSGQFGANSSAKIKHYGMQQYDSRDVSIEGNTLLFKNWTYADVVLNDKQILRKELINYNIDNSKLLMIINDLSYEVPIHNVNSFSAKVLDENVNSGDRTFRRFKIHKIKKSDIFELIFEEGDYALVKRYNIKVIKPSYIAAIDVGTLKPKIKKFETFFIVKDDIAYAINKKRKKAIKELKSLKNVSNYLKNNKLSTKKEKDLIKMIKNLN